MSNLSRLRPCFAPLGTIREFNEDILYLAHSIATTDEVIRPPGAREGDFIRQIDAEIEKVNSWTKRIQAELLGSVHASPNTISAGNLSLVAVTRLLGHWLI